jgi:hypothetical protein
VTCRPQHAAMWAGRASGWRRDQRWRHAAGASRDQVLFHVEQRQSRSLPPPPRCSTWNIRAPGGPDVHIRGQRSRLGSPVRPAIRYPELFPAACQRPAPFLGYPPPRSTSTEILAAASTKCSGGKAAMARIAVARLGRLAQRRKHVSNHPHRTGFPSPCPRRGWRCRRAAR